MQNDFMCNGEVVGVGITVFGSPKLVDTTLGSSEEIARSFASLATTEVWAGLYLKVVTCLFGLFADPEVRSHTYGAERYSKVSVRRTVSGRRIGVGV